MSAQSIGEKLADNIPQALGAREFMIERLILVSFNLKKKFSFVFKYDNREIIHVNCYVKQVEKKKLKMIYLN
jgi:hypothetical protein